ncbi:SDR family oxidoreductase [Arthrobacter sp. NPDC056691]|uniref:SDR family oxidoreductase n=1 Tax=Arthrobacter sp. NPDC056691 TaxID=3345913 RepID=UPI00366B226A
MSHERVLVTGGSGFIAGHCILKLLEEGYQVRTTVRSLSREAAIRSVLTDAGMVKGGNLSFTEADLTGDDRWPEAMDGVDYVLHVASPVVPGNVANEDEVVDPAREGTRRVLRAATSAGVKRVVLTSAFHAVAWGYPQSDHVFTEADWSRLDGPGVDAYARSKTLAEQAAWDFVASEPGTPELTTVLPVAVMGHVLGTDISGANHLLQMMLTGAMPGYPRMSVPIVDVRDVAGGHFLAMITPAAAGQRFLLSNGPAMAMKDIGALLRARLGESANRVPTRTIPDFIVRAAAVFSAQFRPVAADLGFAWRTSNAKARSMLGWEPRPAEEAIVSAAESLVATNRLSAS